MGIPPYALAFLPVTCLSFGTVGENQIRGQCEVLESWKSGHGIGAEGGSELVALLGRCCCYCESDTM